MQQQLNFQEQFTVIIHGGMFTIDISLLSFINCNDSTLIFFICNFDRIEILCHDINVHIPHHVSSKIPSYNLRAAHKSLEENWGKVFSFS